MLTNPAAYRRGKPHLDGVAGNDSRGMAPRPLLVDEVVDTGVLSPRRRMGAGGVSGVSSGRGRLRMAGVVVVVSPRAMSLYTLTSRLVIHCGGCGSLSVPYRKVVYMTSLAASHEVVL